VSERGDMVIAAYAAMPLTVAVVWDVAY